MTDDDLSPVFARAEQTRPRVRQPSSPWTLALGVAGAGALGLMVFGSMSSGRTAQAQTTTAPPPVVAPVQPAPVPLPPPIPAPLAPDAAPPTFASAAPPPDPAEAHWRAPAVVVDLSGAEAAAPLRLAQAPPAPATDNGALSAEERFQSRVTGGSADATRAIQMRNLGRTVTQGSVIPAVLETAINSDLPGSVRAVVSRDVRGFDGAQILVPRGSKLIGQYRQATAVGQSRAFVVWSRIITPTGVSIDVGSPAIDRLGRGGLEGDVDTHFFRRFGAAILLSVLSAGLDAISGDDDTDATLIIGSPAQATRVAEIALQKQIEIPPTIRIPQGAPVQVSVARDLDFSQVR